VGNHNMVAVLENFVGIVKKRKMNADLKIMVGL
jgi:hypothetical protein